MQENHSEKTSPNSFLGLQRSDQLFLGILSIVILILAVIYLGQLSRWGTEPIEANRQGLLPYQLQIDINQATWVEFAQLKNIGPVLGKRIVDHRKSHGPFQSIEDLLSVKGIGPQKLKANRKYFKPILTKAK